MLEGYTIDTFAGRVGQSFALEDEQAGAHELVLTECERLGGNALRRVPFSLVFRGPVCSGNGSTTLCGMQTWGRSSSSSSRWAGTRTARFIRPALPSVNAA